MATPPAQPSLPTVEQQEPQQQQQQQDGSKLQPRSPLPQPKKNGNKPSAGKGRARVPITLIKNERNRLATFTKRKNRLIKKAMELSILCDAEIALVMFAKGKHKQQEESKLFQYASHNIDDTLVKFASCEESHAPLSNSDYFLIFGGSSKSGGKAGAGTGTAGAPPPSRSDPLAAAEAAELACGTADNPVTQAILRDLDAKKRKAAATMSITVPALEGAGDLSMTEGSADDGGSVHVVGAQLHHHYQQQQQPQQQQFSGTTSMTGDGFGAQAPEQQQRQQQDFHALASALGQGDSMPSDRFLHGNLGLLAAVSTELAAGGDGFRERHSGSDGAQQTYSIHANTNPPLQSLVTAVHDARMDNENGLLRESGGETNTGGGEAQLALNSLALPGGQVAASQSMPPPYALPVGSSKRSLTPTVELGGDDPTEPAGKRPKTDSGRGEGEDGGIG
jgi:hypothetical protein